MSNNAENIIRDNINRVRENIDLALQTEGLHNNVELMAVTKTVEPERINMALRCGIDLIGENKVQELLSKQDYIELDGVRRHLIGHLQSNKINKIIDSIDMIESVDSLALIDQLSSKAISHGRQIDCLLEINIGREESKTGFFPEMLDEALEKAAVCRGVNVRGLMCVAPICDTESEVRSYFSSMRKLFIDKSSQNNDNVHMDILSMGMSSDYVYAVKEGANLVRVGSVIFGSRRY